MNDNQRKLVKILNRRLRESVKFWYQCSTEYHDIDEFISTLNALIQSLRHLTFILQSNKDLIPDFENWYKAKQQELKDNKLMQWLNSARVEIVHKKDLELKSYAKFSILNWKNFPIFERKINPLTKNEDIKLPVPIEIERATFHKVFREPLIKIERKWIADSLPQLEILTALAKCYGVLKELVIDTYHQAKIDNPKEKVKDLEKDDYLKRQEAPETNRIHYIDFKNGKPLKARKERFDIPEGTAEEAEKRYGKVEEVDRSKIKDISDPFEYIDYCLEQAKLILKVDKDHAPMLFYFYKDQAPTITLVPTKDKTEQYLLARNIANDIKEKRLTGILFISEMWQSSLENFSKGLLPPDDPKRTELISITTVRNDGYYRATFMPFIRIDNSIIFEEVTIDEDKTKAFWLQTIFDAWDIDYG